MNRYLTAVIAGFLCFASSSQTPCNNAGFEATAAGNYTAVSGWTASQLGPYPGFTNGFCVLHTATMTSMISIVGNYSPPSPFTGSNVALLDATSGLKRLKQIFTVTSFNTLYEYAYKIVLNGPAHPNCCDNSYFRIYFLDSTGTNVLPTCTVGGIATNTSCVNTGTLGMITTTTSIETPGWLVRSVDLSPYLGQKVILVAEAGACTAGGHTASLYFDAHCSPGMYNGNGGLKGDSYLVCGGTATLTAASAPSYTWTGPSGTVNTQDLVTSTPGQYTLAIGNGGCPLTKTINLVLGITPTVSIAGPTAAICKGSSTTLSVVGTGASTYSWSTGSTASFVTVVPTTTTSYTVVANSATCPAMALITVSVKVCASLSDLAAEDAGLSFYPNPSGGVVKFNSNQPCNIQLFDVHGRLVSRFELSDDNGFSSTVVDLIPGMYLVVVKGKVLKLIVTEN